MVRKIENTLYITKPEAYVKKDHEILIVEINKKEVFRVPGHHLGGVILFGCAKISHFALDWCAQNDVTVTRVTQNGRFIGNWIGPTKGNVLLRLDQYSKYNNFKYICNYSKRFVKGKIYNCRAMMLRTARDISNSENEKILRNNSKKLKNILNLIDDSEDVEQVRGFEGMAARIYFSSFNKMILSPQKEFYFSGRSKRPPRDFVNAMLSYLYVLLCHDCRSGLESVGLDAQIGFLHAIRPGKPALALDLMEELRPIMVERLVLTLINRKQIKSNDFVLRKGGAIEMKEECRKKLIKNYQEKKLEEVYHPVLDKNVPYGLIPYVQARFLARTIRGDIEEYPPFIYQ